jgi:uncharacterized protein YigA (DUF484 family)
VGECSKIPRFLNLDTGRRQVANFTLGRFTLGKEPLLLFIEEDEIGSVSVWSLGEKKMPLLVIHTLISWSTIS